MTRPSRCLAMLPLVVVVAGCAVVAGRPSTERTVGPPAWRGPPPPPPDNLPAPAARVAALLEKASFRLADAEATPDGVMGVKKAVVRFPVTGQRLTVKWKEAPAETGDGWNNSPRKEIAAYVMQGWFLDSGDYIVPPSAVRCLPLAPYRRIEPDATATFEDTRCVLGLLSAWLQDVHPPDPLYDRFRFLTDAGYAYHMADFNVLTFLIQHRDGRVSNFLAADAPSGRRLFAVDNGIAFGGMVYNYFVENWDVLRVPAVRARVVERLRRIEKRHLDALAVVAELRTDADGVLRAAKPSAPRAPETGIWFGEGRLQLGLTRSEIADVANRLHALLARVDSGELPVF